MAPLAEPGGREAEVWERLARVDDPELDEPITAMGFVERVTISSGGEEVEVEFRLPTYWCSPNFAFLMAEGIHREVSALPWVARVRVRLHDHLLGEEMSEGLNRGRGFAEIVGEAAAPDQDLEEIRAKFEAKAFQRRQEAVILGLRERGCSDAEIAAMDLRTLDALELGPGEAARQRPRYRELLIKRALAARPEDPAFRTLAGEPLSAAQLPGYLAELRGVRINMEFNGALCRGLARARYREAGRHGEEPTLIDFMRGPRLPAGGSSAS